MTEKLDRLYSCDPEAGHAPLRVWSTRPERVLHLHLTNAWEPQTSMREAFSRLGANGLDYECIEWAQVPDCDLANQVLETAARVKPTLIFMQLQRAGVLSPDHIRQIREAVDDPRLVIATWSGDIIGYNGLLPENCDWVRQLDVDLALHSSMSHVQAWRRLGIPQAAYLQIGWDEDRYQPVDDSFYGSRYDVVFLGQSYEERTFNEQLAEHDLSLRRRAAEVMHDAFGDRFGLFGGGWEKFGAAFLPMANSAPVYHSSHFGLNISLSHDYEKYSSDRLFRILACGCVALVKQFPDYAGLGLEDGRNCLLWDTPEEARDLVKAWRDRPDLREVGRAGAKLAQTHHTWTVRMQELCVYLAALRGEEVETWRPW